MVLWAVVITNSVAGSDDGSRKRRGKPVQRFTAPPGINTLSGAMLMRSALGAFMPVLKIDFARYTHR